MPEDQAKFEALQAVIRTLRPHLSKSWAEGYTHYTTRWRNQTGAGHYAYSSSTTDHDKMIWRNKDNFTAEEQMQITTAHALLFL